MCQRWSITQALPLFGPLDCLSPRLLRIPGFENENRPLAFELFFFSPVSRGKPIAVKCLQVACMKRPATRHV